MQNHAKTSPGVKLQVLVLTYSETAISIILNVLSDVTVMSYIKVQSASNLTVCILVSGRELCTLSGAQPLVKNTVAETVDSVDWKACMQVLYGSRIIIIILTKMEMINNSLACQFCHEYKVNVNKKLTRRWDSQTWWYSNDVDLQYDTTKPIVDATFRFTYLFSSC